MFYHTAIVPVIVWCLMLMAVSSGVDGTTTSSTYKQYHGFTVNTNLETVNARSAKECASICSKLWTRSGLCRSATYNNVTGTCLQSDDRETNIIDVNNPNLKTVLLQQPDQSCMGTEFYTGYVDNTRMTSPVPQLYIVPSEATHVTVYIPYLSVNETFLITEAVMKTYSVNLLHDSTEVTNKGVYVHSDKPITLFRRNNGGGSVGMSIVLPTSCLGMDYIVQTNPNVDTSFIVVGTTENTAVTIRTSSSTVSYTLGRLDTVATTSNSGVSGSIVSADQNVVVVAGAACTNIPSSKSACDTVTETLPPEESFGQTFVISRMYPRPSFMIGIVAKTDDTYVNITSETGAVLETFTMNRANVVHRTCNMAVTVSACKGIQVAQYGLGYSTQSASIPFGDPSMMVIPPLEKFGWQYDILVPDDAINYIEVVADDENHVRFNAITPNCDHALAVNVPGNGMRRVCYVQVLSGTYRITHVRNANFAVFVYGGNTYAEYAFSAGWMK